MPVRCGVSADDGEMAEVQSEPGLSRREHLAHENSRPRSGEAAGDRAATRERSHWAWRPHVRAVRQCSHCILHSLSRCNVTRATPPCPSCSCSAVTRARGCAARRGRRQHCDRAANDERRGRTRGASGRSPTSGSIAISRWREYPVRRAAPRAGGTHSTGDRVGRGQPPASGAGVAQRTAGSCGTRRR